ncbi:hypothetical protein F5050DRAFT_1756461 [Lentinula boryana]|uniref:Uncharacterized protein n=1 Tax=Lentinula boryana TaxID=40481 RepID=A0ABQ8QEH9_9AGAR|nr:hypothetical protein F5050DRAFT_1756461 [Lentinula boryana]
MGPLTVEGENPPENPNITLPNDTPKPVDSSGEPASPPKTSKIPSHEHQHRPHRGSTLKTNPEKDSEVTLRPPRQRGSTAVAGTKPNMQRVDSSGSDYAVTISSSRSGTPGTKNDALSPPSPPPHTHRHGSHHRETSISSYRSHGSMNSFNLERTASGASRGRGGSMHSQSQRPATVDKTKSRGDERQSRERDRAEQRLSALYAAQTAQSGAAQSAAAANAANIFAVTGNPAATNLGMSKAPGMR